jgi:hypothetical protein
VPPGATFDQWSDMSPAYLNSMPPTSWSEGRYRLASPANSEMSIDASPSPSRAPLPYMYGDGRSGFAPSPAPSPSGSLTPLPTGTGPVRPGTVHGRARHNPVERTVPRKRSTTGVALTQFAELTPNLIYPAYDGALRQWSPITLDHNNPVPTEYRDKRGIWDAKCFWSWDSTVKTHASCIRICAQCHTATPGAKTWRRSHIQQDTSVSLSFPSHADLSSATSAASTSTRTSSPAPTATGTPRRGTTPPSAWSTFRA